MSLEGKVAVIHGGGGPLSRAIEKKFLAEGAKMVIGWHSPEEWAEAEELIADYKGQFVDMRVDPTKEEQVKEFMKKAKDTFGTIDILLNVTGSFVVGPKVWETDVAIWDKQMEVNLKSAFLCSKHAIPVMLEKKSGRVIFFSARPALDPMPGFGAESVSKTGLVTLTRVLREELKDTDITVNVLMISIIDTWRTRKIPNAEPDKWLKPSEVADLVYCICLDECSALSGSMLTVYGKL